MPLDRAVGRGWLTQNQTGRSATVRANLAAYPRDPHRRRQGFSLPAKAPDVPITPISGLSATTVQEALEELGG